MGKDFQYHQIAEALILFSLILFLVPALNAQTVTGRAIISGVISDPSGGAIPGVRVTITDKERGVSYSAQTNSTGFYRFSDLLLSTYSVTAEKPGFQTYVLESFPLTAAQEAVLNISMKVGSVKQRVTVRSQVQMIQPGNATLGGLVNNALIVNLPLVNRNVVTLMATLPGVAPSTPNSYQSTFFTSAVRYSVNGGLESTSQMELDGLSFLNQSDIPGILGLSVLPSVDSIQDLRVQTNDYSAAYGRSGGGITTMVTKSGTNQFHGDAYEFLQNNAFEANSFFSNRSGGKIPPYHYDDYGFTVGGPVIKKHTFFFFSFERNLNHAGTFGLFTVPTAAERNGDFSQDFNSAGQLITIYNPFTTTPNPAQPGTYLRTSFPGNKIPASLMDPVAAKATSYYPAPNLPGTPIPGTSLFTPVNNFGATAVASTPVQLIDFRVDHNFSDRMRAFIRYDYFSTSYGSPNIFGNPADEGFGTLSSTGHNAVIGFTQSFGASTVLDLRAGFDRFVAYRPSQGLGFNLTTLGLPQSLVAYSALGNEPLFPFFGPQGYSSLGNNEGPYYTSHNTDYLGSATLAKIIGRHTLQVGADTTSFFLNFFQVNGFVTSFSNAMTQGPNPLTVSNTDGDGFASFLLGAGGSGSISDGPQPANANHYFAEYLEDNFHWTPKFTIDLGFRLEEETATTERFNRLTAINPSVLNPISKDVGFNVYGGYVFAGNGPDNLGRRAIAPMEWKPNPRIGIAYMLNNKTVIRAGYGIFYGVPMDGATDSFTGGTFSTSTPFLGTLDGIHPNNSLSNPFPNGYVYPAGTSLGLLSNVGLGLGSGWPQAIVDMYNQQWNFTIQRSITPNTLFQVAYVGNKGTHLGMFECCGAYSNMNQLPVSDLSQGNALLNLVSNPFYGFVTGGTLAQPMVQAGQLERPFPEWTSVTPTDAGWGNSNYEALQAMFQKRYTNGTTFTASYTWSKMMSDGIDGRWNDAVGAAGFLRNWYCLECEYAVNSYDVPQRLVLSAASMLPFGEGKRFGSSWRGVTNAVLGGWQANGILTLASGMPLVFSTAQNTSFSFGGGQHPNLVGNPATGFTQSIDEWFNTAAFAQPANFTFGNLGRTETAVRQDWTRDLDFSLFKNFTFKERYQLQFRAEAFNLTNVPIFGGPDTALGTPGFGVIGGQANAPRTFQLALKFMF